MEQDRTHFKLRVAPDLKAWVEQQAKASHRSMTAEINFRLEEARRAMEQNTCPRGAPATELALQG